MPPRRSERLKKLRGEGNHESCTTLVPYLHHDIRFDIFSWFSALCLHNIVNRVCKSWASIITHPDFVDTHLCRSTYGLFIQTCYNSARRFLEVVNNKLVITEMNFKKRRLGLPGSTYQGVMLFRTGDIYTVINPVTMQITEICKSELPIDMDNHSRYLGVIRDRCSGDYKLVLSFYSFSEECGGWYVKKLGSGSKWDKIIANERYRFPGLAVGGFLCHPSHRSIIVLDVSDETVCKISCPGGYCPKSYLPMGNTAALSSISFDSERIFIHVLTDFHAGNWSLYHVLDSQSLYSRSKVLLKTPGLFQFFLGWINNNEQLVGRLCTYSNCSELGSCYKGTGYSRTTCPCSTRECRDGMVRGKYGEWIYFTYNPKTKHTRYLDSYISRYDIVRIHTNSLVSW